MAASDAARSIPGVSYVDDDMMNATLVIIFDDAMSTLDTIKTTMKNADFPIEGEPELLK